MLASKGGASRERLEKDLEESLQRRQTDYLDIYMIHWPDASVPMDDPMGALSDFLR